MTTTKIGNIYNNIQSRAVFEVFRFQGAGPSKRSFESETEKKTSIIFT